MKFSGPPLKVPVLFNKLDPIGAPELELDEELEEDELEDDEELDDDELEDEALDEDALDDEELLLELLELLEPLDDELPFGTTAPPHADKTIAANVSKPKWASDFFDCEETGCNLSDGGRKTDFADLTRLKSVNIGSSGGSAFSANFIIWEAKCRRLGSGIPPRGNRA